MGRTLIRGLLVKQRGTDQVQAQSYQVIVVIAQGTDVVYNAAFGRTRYAVQCYTRVYYQTRSVREMTLLGLVTDVNQN